MHWFSPSIPLSHSTYLSHSISLSPFSPLLSLFHILSLFSFPPYQSLSFPAVTIGFDPDSYTVTEDDGPITFTVTVLDGTLGRDVEVTFTTEDGIAIGEHVVWQISSCGHKISI